HCDDLLKVLLFEKLLVFFSSRRRHTRSKRDWSSDVCSSDLASWASAVRPAPDDRLTIAPPPLSRMAGISCFIARKTPVRLTAMRSEERRVGREWRRTWRV